MEPTQIGLLLLGLGVLINFGKEFYQLLFKPKEDSRDSMSAQEKTFNQQIHNIQMQNVEYQKEILQQLGMLNGILSVQDNKVVTITEKAKENRIDIKDLHARVSVLESRIGRQ